MKKDNIWNNNCIKTREETKTLNCELNQQEQDNNFSVQLGSSIKYFT